MEDLEKDFSEDLLHIEDLWKDFLSRYGQMCLIEKHCTQFKFEIGKYRSTFSGAFSIKSQNYTKTKACF